MVENPESAPQRLVRVVATGQPAFQLRKGEEGLSVFDAAAIDPPLTDAEILLCFRAGSQLVTRTAADIEAKGLQVVPAEGAAILPERLRHAHHEIRPGPGMTRELFKRALRELE